MSDCTCFKEPDVECPVHVPAGQVEPAVSAWDLLGIAPDWTDGCSCDYFEMRKPDGYIDGKRAYRMERIIERRDAGCLVHG
jgi:hypothetical protein